MRHNDVVNGRSFRIDRRRLLAAMPVTLASLALPARGIARQEKPTLTNGDTRSGLAGLREMLGYIPASQFDDPQSAGLVWTYADFALQLDTLGIPTPGSSGDLPDGYLNAITVLAPVSGIYAYALVEEFTDAIGFKPMEVERSLLAGTPPSQISLHSGGIDLDALPGVWAASGYSEMTTESGVSWWNLAPDGSLDVNNPIQKRAISALNNVAVLGEVVVATGTIAAMEEVIATWSGERDALSNHDATVKSLANMPEDSVSAAGFNPDIYFASAIPPEEIIAEFDQEFGPMPRLEAIVSGITAGFHATADDGLDPAATPDIGLDDSRIVTCLVTESASDAAEAASVAESRWQSGASLRTGEELDELMPLVSATSVDDVAILEYRHPRSPRAWIGIFTSQDAYALAPGG